jgi:hypothetical protein
MFTFTDLFLCINILEIHPSLGFCPPKSYGLFFQLILCNLFHQMSIILWDDESREETCYPNDGINIYLGTYFEERFEVGCAFQGNFFKGGCV